MAREPLMPMCTGIGAYAGEPSCAVQVRLKILEAGAVSQGREPLRMLCTPVCITHCTHFLVALFALDRRAAASRCWRSCWHWNLQCPCCSRGHTPESLAALCRCRWNSSKLELLVRGETTEDTLSRPSASPTAPSCSTLRPRQTFDCFPTRAPALALKSLVLVLYKARGIRR